MRQSLRLNWLLSIKLNLWLVIGSMSSQAHRRCIVKLFHRILTKTNESFSFHLHPTHHEHANSSDCPIQGMCLSGCITDEDGERLSADFQSTWPEVARCCVVANDIVGPVYTCNTDSGIVLISGTGSNSLLFNRNVSIQRLFEELHQKSDD